MTSRGWFPSFNAMTLLVLVVIYFSVVAGIKPLERKEENQVLLAYKPVLEKCKSKLGTSFLSEKLAKDVETKVKFYLFRRSNLNSSDILVPGNASSLANSHFDLSKPTKVLIHGFLDSVNGDMITTVKQSFLDAMDVNILAMDWSGISVSINYFGVAKKTKEVGEYLARMLDFLSTQGYDFSGYHLIGHSLGAHVCGYAGRSVLQGVIPRITGLDPALPGFKIIDIAERLTTSDASFVDVIHTCGGLLGIYEPIGHADFYPNSGFHPQPGCPILDAAICSHFRAFEFFSESVYNNHLFSTKHCTSLAKLLSECNETTIIMGYPVNSSARGIYIGATNKKYPFAPDVL